MFNPQVETMARSEIQALQLNRLQKTVERCYHNSRFYREKMDALGVKPEDIQTLDDLRRLPFTNKTDLRDNYPFGLFSAPMEEIVRVHASSGTTGKPTTVGYTKNDIDAWAECTARALGCAGGRKNDVVQISYGYGLFTGGLGLHYGAERLRATALPTSSGNTQRQIMLMQDFGTSILACTPSYALMLGETMRDMGIDTNKLRLRAGTFGAEPWTEGMRRQIEDLMGIDALDIYGLSETMGPGVAIECKEEKHGLHIWEDNVIVEIVDPVTLQPVPEGEVGELVLTTINREAMPLLRYRTRDLTCILPGDCPCGRTHKRLARFKGRSDDMIILKGVNLFPIQIEKILMQFKELGSNYLITLETIGNSDEMLIEVELSDLFTDDYSALQRLTKGITRQLKDELLLTPRIKLVAKGSLPTTDGKAVRVKDHRKLC